MALAQMDLLVSPAHDRLAGCTYRRGPAATRGAERSAGGAASEDLLPGAAARVSAATMSRSSITCARDQRYRPLDEFSRTLGRDQRRLRPSAL